jgi:5'-methylthioadenosine phosphorylase
MEPTPIAVIGGSGLYHMDGLDVLEEVKLDTPFGPTSDAVIIARLGERRVAFLPRHGRGHRFSPSNLPYRANIWALKRLGVRWCVAVSAVGSLREEIAPEDFVIPDQLIDRTRARPLSLFEGLVAHVGFAYPFNPMLREVLLAACRAEGGFNLHAAGTYVCMEGPQFSTRAESFLYRAWGADIIGMTALPEAKFAREAEIAYATIALATDYDVWKDEEHVSVEAVMARMCKNVVNAQKVLRRVILAIPLGAEAESGAANALESAIMTDPKLISAAEWDAWGDLLLSKYMARP